jgi:hypothetical protein
MKQLEKCYISEAYVKTPEQTKSIGKISSFLPSRIYWLF